MLNVKKQKQNKKTGRKWTRVTTFTAKGPHQWNIYFYPSIRQIKVKMYKSGLTCLKSGLPH